MNLENILRWHPPASGHLPPESLLIDASVPQNLSGSEPWHFTSCVDADVSCITAEIF